MAELVSASKSVKILELPEIMILHLMSFSYGSQGSTKLLKPVYFPLELLFNRDLLVSPSAEEQMKSYKPPEDGSVPVNPFLAVMSKEYDGHHRLFNRGVTNKLIKKVNGGKTSDMVPGELMESLKATIEAEKSQLTDMRKELEEDHERKKG